RGSPLLEARRGFLDLVVSVLGQDDPHKSSGRTGMAWITTGSSPPASRTPTSSNWPSLAGPISIVKSSLSAIRITLWGAWSMSSSAIPCFLAESVILTVTRYLVTSFCQGFLSSPSRRVPRETPPPTIRRTLPSGGCHGRPATRESKAV